MAKGAKYLIMKKKIFLSDDFNVPSLDISAKNSCLPNFQPKKMTISNPPRGNRTLDETKSIRSKTVMPPMAKGVFSIRLSEAKLPMTSVRTHVRIVAFFRLRCNSSERKATTTSSSEIVDKRESRRENDDSRQHCNQSVGKYHGKGRGSQVVGLLHV